MTGNTKNKQVALVLHRRGYCPVPVNSTKRPLVKWRKFADPENPVRPGVSDVERWWTQWPDASVAMITGRVSGLVVLDFDGEEGNALLEGTGLEPHIRTGSGGHHLYVHHPGWFVKSISGVKPGLDVKGDAGMALFHGSNECGSYEHLRKLEPVAAEDLPEWLREVAGLARPPEVKSRTRSAESPEDPDGEGRGWVEKALSRAGNSTGRNETGLWLACQLRDAGLSQEQAEAFMLEYADRVGDTDTKGHVEPYTHDEALETLRQAFDRPAREPTPKKGKPKDKTKAKQTEAGYHLTELGNSLRLIDQHGEDIRFCFHQHGGGDLPSGKWLTWEGEQWCQDATAGVGRAALQTVLGMYREAAEVEMKEERGKLVAWAKANENDRRIRGMLNLAKLDPRIAIEPDELDANPWLLNTPSGTLELKTDTLREHRREDLITKITGAPCDLKAECPRWERFLHEIMGGDEDLIEYLRRVVGYALTGDTSEQKLFILYGTSANGKSTFLNTLLWVLGDYALMMAPDLLMLTPGQEHPTAMADLHGVRLAVGVEIEHGRFLMEQRVKMLTGGERVKARRMRQDYWDFEMRAKLFMAVNSRPQIKGQDHALWRRISLIPFKVAIPEERQDKQLASKLREEGAGILRWAVLGCGAWQERGLDQPEAVTDETREYRSDQDILGDFLAERCTFEAKAQESSSALWAEYGQWCEENKERQITRNTFGEKLRMRGMKPIRGGGGKRIWIGIRLRR